MVMGVMITMVIRVDVKMFLITAMVKMMIMMIVVLLLLLLIVLMFLTMVPIRPAKLW